MAKKPSHGGARKGAGRKPVADPKISITIYVEKSIVDANGDVEEVRELCYEFLKKRRQAKV